jgi:aminoglycoside phosphotransferase (APT) family kinase protein
VTIDPSRPEQVGPALLDYLAARLGAADLRFAEPLEELTQGWETHIYAFRLAGEGLDATWARPLILRLYRGSYQPSTTVEEAALQRFVAERGYPAPRPLAVEPADGPLGWPFMVMERAPGVTMLDRMGGNPVAAFRSARRMADLQVALHRLPVEGCPLPSDGALVDRDLAFIAEMIARYGVDLTEEMREALGWLEAHKGIVADEDVALCHHDFHPLNIMVDDAGRVAVIDWPGAALGDRHSDIAGTLVLLRTAPVDSPSLRERLMTRFGRDVFCRLYLRRYAGQLAIDPERLRYWEAFRAFVWWLMVLALQSSDSLAALLKPGITDRIPAGHLEEMRRYFLRRTGA